MKHTIYPPANSSAVLQNRPSPSCTARPFLEAPAATGKPSEVSARILRARSKASSSDTSLHHYQGTRGRRRAGDALEAKHSDVVKQLSE